MTGEAGLAPAGAGAPTRELRQSPVSADAAPKSDVELTVDAFLGGRFEALQPARGHHRAGLEAILLAAAVREGAGLVVDFGAGVGVAGFAVAARLAASRVVLVEREPDLCEAARLALARPANAGFAARATIAAVDIAAPEAQRVAAGVPRAMADVAIMNPPFRAAGGGTASPQRARRAAHVLAGGLDPWLRAAAAALRPGGDLVAIVAATLLPDLLAAIGNRFGGLSLLPIHPRADAPALRLVVRGRKGGRAAPSLLPGLVLHGPAGNHFLPPVEAMLRDGASLAAAYPPWRQVG